MTPVEGFLSEDGATYTAIREESNVNPDSKDDKGSGGELDLSSFSDEQRPVIEKLLGDLKEKDQLIDGLKGKADIADILKVIASKPEASRDNGRKAADDDDEDDDPLKGINFEKDDYYEKFFRAIAGKLKDANKTIKELKGNLGKTTQQDFVDKVKNFVASEKLSKEVILKMDEIAKGMGPGTYNDLPRLAKLAKVELGIPLDSKGRNVENEEDDRDNRKKNIVEFGRNKRKSSVQKPQVKSMLDAWEQAEEQLSQE